MDISYHFRHYIAMPGILTFFLFSFLIVFVIHLLLMRKAQRIAGTQGNKAAYHLYKSLKEEYYELMFSATSMLLFTGVYFVLDYQWVPMSSRMVTLWREYNDFILLGLMILSIVLVNILDGILIPLQKLEPDKTASLRVASMVYMLILFAYIKFIYKDDNYDTIIFYFLTMLVSRYVYVDASLGGFRDSFKGFWQTLNILLLVLLSTALLALFGFRSGYLLTSNSVAVSLWIAHCFVIFECFLLSVTGIANRVARKLLVGKGSRQPKTTAPEDPSDENS